MNWIKDRTGRFPERPYYEQDELDSLSEGLIADFLRERYGHVSFPVSTEDLTVLVENHTSDLDQYADLDPEGEDVEGMTLFFKDRDPAVKISEHLDSSGPRNNRFRTTLTHELGHVKLHGFLWQFHQLPLLPREDNGLGPRCKRAGILGASQTDWMEWQAGYMSGALLMPTTSLKKLVSAAFKEWEVFGSVAMGSGECAKLISRAAAKFGVSHDAARVRLSQFGIITDQHRGPSLYQK